MKSKEVNKLDTILENKCVEGKEVFTKQNIQKKRCF